MHPGWHRHHRQRGHWQGSGRWGTPVGRYVRKRMHRRIFLLVGFSIVLTMIFSSGFWHFGDSGAGWKRREAGIRAFTAERFAKVWDNPPERAALAQSLAQNLDVDLAVVDSRGAVLNALGAPCRHPFKVPVSGGGAALGTVELCRLWGSSSPSGFLVPIIFASLLLWGFTGGIARRLTRPLGEVARVAQEIGAGKLSARAEVGWRDQHSEAGMLAFAINDMADRIQKQLADQRELLAVVSHELRTPLARIRLLTELGRSNGSDPKTMDELDREVIEIDQLVGDLLASSRLDFAALSVHRLDAVDVAKRALQRAGLDAALLQLEGAPGAFTADPTLVARALANLLDNAQGHGGGPVALRVRAQNGAVCFEVDDAGPGFSGGDEGRAFDAFFQRPKDPEKDQGSLGLGLSLVKRIAEAHGGKAYAANRAPSGARVGFELPLEAAFSPRPR